METDLKKLKKKVEGENPVKASKKAMKSPEAAKKSKPRAGRPTGPRAATEGMTSLQQLCDRAGVEGHQARIILRRNDIPKSEGRYEWKTGSSQEKQILALLSGTGKKKSKKSEDD